MTSNIFRVFGILILLLLVYSMLNWSMNTKSPALKAADQFLAAVKTPNRAALEQVLDASNAETSFAGEKVTTIAFKKVNVFPGAFSEKPATKFAYLELNNMRIRTDERPSLLTPSGKTAVASVPLWDGGTIYLREQDGQWKVFYIDSPTPATR